jgi:hypothetical protein
VQFEFAEHAAWNSKGKVESPEGTPAQGVGRVKEVWASTGRRATPTHDLHHAGNARSAEPLAAKHARENPPQLPVPTIKKKKERKQRQAKHRHPPTKQLTTPTEVCGPCQCQPPSCRERTGGAVVLEGKPRVVTLVVRRNPGSAVPRFQARLRAQRRDARAVGSA